MQRDLDFVVRPILGAGPHRDGIVTALAQSCLEWQGEMVALRAVAAADRELAARLQDELAARGKQLAEAATATEEQNAAAERAVSAAAVAVRAWFLDFCPGGAFEAAFLGLDTQPASLDRALRDAFDEIARQVAVAAVRAEAARADAATANARVKRLAKAVERDAAA